MDSVDNEEALILVKLDCGEPVSVQVSHPDLENIPVAFVESFKLADEYDDVIALTPDEIVVKQAITIYEDLEEVQSLLEDGV